MTSNQILSLADPAATLGTVGGKGASLARLARAGLPVPDGFHITTAAYRRFVRENHLEEPLQTALAQVDPARPSTLEAASRQIEALFTAAPMPEDVAAATEAAYRELARSQSPETDLGVDGQVRVAVRSSATAEDLPDLSFAGQQETWLNVRGSEQVLEAVKRCWASLWTARAIGYRLRHGVDHRAVSMGVVVQVLVPAEAAGILFTANPMTGDCMEVVVNAAWGLGEAIVGGQVTPDMVIADKASGQIKQVQVADKAVMTVLAAAGTVQEPVPEARRAAAVLSDAQVHELVKLGRRVEALASPGRYGANGLEVEPGILVEPGIPQDIEWCWDGERFFVLQSRPITTLKEGAVGASLPVVPPPSEWRLPNPRAKYLRNNIVELMPDPLTPLFATLGLRVVNTALARFTEGVMDVPGVLPSEVVVTIQGYAYYNGSFTAGQILRLLLHGVGIARRMFTGMEPRWRTAHETYAETVAAWQERWPGHHSASAILDGVCELMDAAIQYYGASVSGLIPAAWITESLFTRAYLMLINRQADPAPATFLLGFDSRPLLAEKALYDLASWTRDQDEALEGGTGLSGYLLSTPSAMLAQLLGDDCTPDGVQHSTWEGWKGRMRGYLRAHGASIYDLDFAKPTPADDPTPVLETFKLYLDGRGRNPHERQQAAARRRETATQAALDRLRGPRLALFRKLVAQAQHYAPLREDALADIGLGYPLAREMLLELGRRLAQAGAIAAADDIFWLEEQEVKQAVPALDSGNALESLEARVSERRALWQARQQVTPPVALPLPGKLLGAIAGRLMPAQFGEEQTESPVIKGVACSPGAVTAPARVLHGPEDFDAMQPGEVLVAAITTPAWTPLFAMAAAIVTDVGGPLSHGSIVAREYGVPAVLGTGVATRRIHSGQVVTVDGSAGLVRLKNGRN